jgi:hypothetical protein
MGIHVFQLVYRFEVCIRGKQEVPKYMRVEESTLM